MKISNNCLDLVEHYEGLRLEAYRCPAGVLTIGYGTIRYPEGEKVKEGDTCTKEQAEVWLKYELNKASDHLNDQKWDLNQNQHDALCSFIYNLGWGALKGSTLYLLIDKNINDPKIGMEFYRWVRAGGEVLKGLQFRRLSEYHLYVTGQLKFDWK